MQISIHEQMAAASAVYLFRNRPRTVLNSNIIISRDVYSGLETGPTITISLSSSSPREDDSLPRIDCVQHIRER